MATLAQLQSSITVTKITDSEYRISKTYKNGKTKTLVTNVWEYFLVINGPKIKGFSLSWAYRNLNSMITANGYYC